MIKVFLFIFLALFSVFADGKVKKLVIAGPVATVSHPFLKMIESGALSDVAESVEFKLWNNPDELRAMLINNQVDFVAIPTNVAATLYNKDVELKLLSVSIWGILEIVSRDKNIKSLEDLKGKEIVVPFRADMPDIVLQALIKKMGLDPKKDFKLKYVATPPDAVQSLILRQSDNVLLAEPATSMVMRKTKSFPVSLIAPEIARVVNLQDEWGKKYGTKSEMPQAGIASVGKKDEKLVKRFVEEYTKALEWYRANPKDAGVLTSKTIKFFNPEVIEDSIPNVVLKNRVAGEARPEIEQFFRELEAIEPKQIGGKLPNDGFYYK